jgi:hypothetical protein
MKNNGEESPKLLGVLGGMGPAATIDFMDKLIRVTGGRKGSGSDTCSSVQQYCDP